MHAYFLQDVKIDITAILNDTTGTLMSCAWKNHNCKIGLIVGRLLLLIHTLNEVKKLKQHIFFKSCIICVHNNCFL